MPHVVVKLWPGKSEQQKTRLAEEIANDVMAILDYGEESVSVAFEEIQSQDWAEKVYRPDIQGKWNQLIRNQGTRCSNQNSSETKPMRGAVLYGPRDQDAATPVKHA